MSDSKGDAKIIEDYKYFGLSKEETRKHDKTFKGPISNRSCTDIICCILFIVFVLALIFVSFWAYLFGDFNKLIHPTNSEGEICGISPAVKNKTKLVFFNLFACVKLGPAVFAFGCPTKQICVSTCPSQLWITKLTDNRNNMVCVGDKNGTDSQYADLTIDYLIKSKTCAEYVFPSISVLDRCIPDFTKVVSFLENKNNTNLTTADQKQNIMTRLSEYNKLFSVADVTGKIVSDLQKSYVFISLCLLLALLLSLIYLVLLKVFVRVMVWITIVLFVLIFVTGSVVCFFTYYLLRSSDIILKEKFKWYALTNFQNMDFWLITGIIMSVILLLILLVLIFLRSRIQIAIAILRSTSKSLKYMMGLLVWPICLFVMQLVLISGILLLLCQLWTVRNALGVEENIHNLTYLNGSEMANTMKQLIDKIPCIPGTNTTSGKMCTFLKYGSKTYVYVFMGFVLFMFFWLTNFIKALGQITIAGSFASYYFAFRKPKDIPTFPVILSFWRAIRYHLGSLAFGSLILAIVQFIKAILEYLDQKAKTGQNIIAEFLVKCLKCCFWCLEMFIKFLNKNAYIMIAIYGQCFCMAAKNAFNLILRNVVRVFVVDQVTSFVLFMGKLVIVGCLGTLSFVFFNGMLLKGISPKLFYFYVPVIIIVIGSYIIASMFFQIFEMGTDTIFLCFCEDLERNDGSPEKPYFMSKELMSILGKNNNENLELK
uniref:Choline transporter-like protein n=1 Tax=Schmidtea mediterranea TaxID=79327 RepID=A0A0H3YFN3_SCHMD|nr:slc44a-3 [Schmidtea mediterranea]